MVIYIMLKASGNLKVIENIVISGNINLSLLNDPDPLNYQLPEKNLYLYGTNHYINCGNGGGVIQYYSPYEHKFYVETSNDDLTPTQAVVINQNGNTFYKDTNFMNAINLNAINLNNANIKLNYGFYNNFVYPNSTSWRAVEVNDFFQFTHGLNVDVFKYPPRLKVLFSNSITPILGETGDVIVDITGQNMNTGGQVGYSIRYMSIYTIQITFGNKQICVVSDGEQYSSGYIKLFMYK